MNDNISMKCFIMFASTKLEHFKAIIQSGNKSSRGLHVCILNRVGMGAQVSWDINVISLVNGIGHMISDY